MIMIKCPICNEEITKCKCSYSTNLSPVKFEGNDEYLKNEYNYFLTKEGEDLSDYLVARGYDNPDITGYRIQNLDGAVAAIEKTYSQSGIENILIKDDEFQDKIEFFSKVYGISYDDALTYVLSHETVHAAGELTEAGVESVLAQYFSVKAEYALENKDKYLKLAEVANYRALNSEDSYILEGESPMSYKSIDLSLIDNSKMLGGSNSYQNFPQIYQ